VFFLESEAKLNAQITGSLSMHLRPYQTKEKDSCIFDNKADALFEHLKQKRGAGYGGVTLI
jgi:hypothetical protein